MADWKLVRDKVVDQPDPGGRSYEYRVVTNYVEYGQLLRKKLLEEVNELFDVLEEISRGNGRLHSHACEEMADVLEVLHALMTFYKMEDAYLDEVRLVKACKRGRYTRRIALREKRDEEAKDT